MVRILSGGANGSSSRKRQTPLKLSGLVRSAHLASNAVQRCGRLEAVPVVGHVEQAAAARADEAGVRHDRRWRRSRD